MVHLANSSLGSVAWSVGRRSTECAYTRAMRDLRSGLVNIIRDFLTVHDRANRLFGRRGQGELRFDEVRSWVGEDSRSALFRLKETCHAIFRPSEDEDSLDMKGGALLDLAVGSLFHEAMKLRENLYQQERYGPRVRAFQGSADADTRELLTEFEKNLSLSAQRLEESVAEVQVLLEQTGKQLRRVMVESAANGITARSLCENQSAVEAVYPEGLDNLLGSIFGDAATGYFSAAISYLESAYYAEALGPLEEARHRAPGRGDIQGVAAYAQGMLAFFSRDYGSSVKFLAQWIEAEEGGGRPEWIRQALAGTLHIERLQPDEEAPKVIKTAAALSAQLKAQQAG
ncbi:MAG: hypothetical protein P8M78_07335 [Myxococcota bacterium]|nr:hypothetical protein [Myxococcota bacterium]